MEEDISKKPKIETIIAIYFPPLQSNIGSNYDFYAQRELSFRLHTFGASLNGHGAIWSFWSFYPVPHPTEEKLHNLNLA